MSVLCTLILGIIVDDEEEEKPGMVAMDTSLDDELDLSKTLRALTKLVGLKLIASLSRALE
jgi:hypothetical protein